MAINNPTANYADFIINDVNVNSSQINVFSNNNKKIELLMQTTGGYTTTENFGTLYDSGGPNSNYSLGDLSYVIIRPKGNSLTLTVEEADIEGGFKTLLKAFKISDGNESLLDNGVAIIASSAGISYPASPPISIVNSDLAAQVGNSFTLSTNVIIVWRSVISGTAQSGFKLSWSAPYQEKKPNIISTIDGPLSLKGSGQPYKLTTSKKG